MLSILFLAGCGQSKLLGLFHQATQSQGSLDAKTLSLWPRSPDFDSGNPALTAEDDLDFLVPRQALPFTDISDVHAPLRNDRLRVYDTPTHKWAPSFFDWAGRTASWLTPDYQVLEAYYHTMRAMNHAEKLFGLESPVWSAGHPFVVNANAASPGSSSLDTAYDPKSVSISFYRQGGSQNPNFNPIDEADSIYHEFGHAIQDSMAHTIASLDPGTNTDADTLLEGLADVHAVSMVQDNNILRYLSSNAPLFRRPDRHGSAVLRSAANGLFFPNAFVGESHFNGRVISGAIDDFRRHLMGQTVTQLSQCATGQCAIASTTPVLAKQDAFDDTLLLAYSPLTSNLASNSSSLTLEAYAKAVYNNCSSATFASWCQPHAHQLLLILTGRGLISPHADVTDYTKYTFGSDPNSSTILLDSVQLGWMPFPNDSGFANNNGQVDPCEVIVIFPILTNNTGLNAADASLYDINVRLLASTGFTAMTDPTTNQVIDPITPTSSPLGQTYPSKVFGWMEVGESSQDLIRNLNPRWYTPQLGASFTQPLSSSFFPLPVGWLVRAPATGAASATFDISLRIYNSTSYRAIPAQPFSVTASLTVPSPDTANFCPSH